MYTTTHHSRAFHLFIKDSDFDKYIFYKICYCKYARYFSNSLRDEDSITCTRVSTLPPGSWAGYTLRGKAFCNFSSLHSLWNTPTSVKTYKKGKKPRKHKLYYLVTKKNLIFIFIFLLRINIHVPINNITIVIIILQIK